MEEELEISERTASIHSSAIREAAQSGGNRGLKTAEAMNTSESSIQPNSNLRISEKPQQNQKPRFRPAKDDTKPVLQDPILRSDPIETEEAVLRLPPFSIARSTSPSKMT